MWLPTSYVCMVPNPDGWGVASQVNVRLSASVTTITPPFYSFIAYHNPRRQYSSSSNEIIAVDSVGRWEFDVDKHLLSRSLQGGIGSNAYVHSTGYFDMLTGVSSTPLS